MSASSSRSPEAAARGSSVLTDSGRRLIELYRRIEHKAAEAARSEIRQLMKLLAKQGGSGP